MNAPITTSSGDIPAQLIGDQNKPFGKVERMISRRYLGAKKKDGGVGLIASLSFFCIMLAVWAMIVIMSIMNGFRDEMIRLTIGSEGHMYVASSSPQPTPDSVAQLQRRVETVPGIEKVFEMTQSNTMVQTINGVTGVQVIGISPQSMKSFKLIADNLVLGSLDGFGEGRGQDNQVALGSGVARQLNVTTGDTVVVYSPRVRANPMMGSTPIRKTFTVGAIYEIGLLQADTLYMYMGLNQAQLLFNDGKTEGTLQIRLDNPDEIDGMVQKVANAAREPLFIETWRDRNQGTATALRTEQIVMRMIFMIVVIIATFPVLSAMIMLVKNKSRDIAVLRTIGATRAGILRIFLMSGAAIGVLGTLAGLIFGILFCLNIEPIQKLIEFISGAPLFPPEVYGLSGVIPVKIVWSEVLGVAFWGFLITTLATYFPSRNASKIDPVEALRYE